VSEGQTSVSEACPSNDAVLLNAMMDWMPGGLVHVAADGGILHANARALKLLGLSHERLTDRYTTDFETETIWEDGTPCADADYPVTRALITGETQEPITIGVRREDGTVTWAIFTAVPLMSAETGAVASVMVLFVDVTERKRLQQERRELDVMRRDLEHTESLARLSGGIAHDINNLMTVVMGHSAALDVSAPETGRHVTEVLRAAERAAHLARQLLAFGRRQLMQIESVNIDALLTRLQPDLQRLLSAGATLELTCASDGHLALGDERQLQALLVSLVENGAEAVDAGGTVHILTAREGDALVIEVRDDGCGIDPAVRERVFEPFFTTRAGRPGRGLGLSSAQGIAVQSGGTITIESALGVGTTVRVALKRVPRNQSTPSHRALKRATPRVQALGQIKRRPVVLLAEDEEEVRALFTRALELGGYQVCDVPDGHAALEVAQSTSIDILVTDILMPGMTGIELARTLRASYPELPVVFVTGYADAASLKDVDGAVMLQKPFPPSHLLAALSKVSTTSESAGLL
jgi:two-component system cell cycle sensor histidine kinase/response regulator CckA